METNEIKKIWQTLSNENLIDERIAKENIERIISQKSSSLMTSLTKKLKSDFILNITTVFLLLSVIVIASLILKDRFYSVAIQGLIFIILTISFFVYKALIIKSQINLINTSYNATTILDSLNKVKKVFIKEYRKEATINMIVIGSLTSFANVLLIDNTDLSEFSIFSLTGFIMIFSVLYLVLLPWLSKLIYKKRFSNIVSDIDNSIKELDIEIK